MFLRFPYTLPSCYKLGPKNEVHVENFQLSSSPPTPPCWLVKNNISGIRRQKFAPFPPKVQF